MSDHLLMQRGSEQMNVPPEKVQAFLDDGWIVIKKAEPEPTETPVGAAAPEAEEEAARKIGKKSK